MPANTLITPNVYRVKEDVENEIFNFNPSDAPLTSMIDRQPVYNVFHEWTRDLYRTPNGANAAIEGADATYAAQTEPTPLNNRTQIIQDTMSVSNTAQAVRKYGRKDEISYLRTRKMVELKRDIEAAIVGNGAAVTGTSGTAGQLRGMYGFITNALFGAGGAAPNPVTNTAPVVGTLAALTEAEVLTGLQTAYLHGGSGEVLMVTPQHKQKISSSFTGNVTKFSDVSGKAPATLNVAFDFYHHDFGVTKVVPNRVMGAGTPTAGLLQALYIFDSDKLALGVLRPFEAKELAQTGDAINYQVLTEVTLVVRDEKPLYSILDRTTTGS